MKKNNKGVVDIAGNFDAQQAIKNSLTRYFVLLLAAPAVWDVAKVHHRFFKIPSTIICSSQRELEVSRK